MMDLEIIEKLERHIGFVFHRLNCDGNWYAQKLNVPNLNTALQHLGEGCLNLRAALKENEENATREKVQASMDSFKRPETDGWE